MVNYKGVDGGYSFQSYFWLLLSLTFREDHASGCSTDLPLASLYVNGFCEKKAGCLSYPIWTECPGFFSCSSLPNVCFASKAEEHLAHLLLGVSISHPCLADHFDSHLPSLLLSCILDSDWFLGQWQGSWRTAHWDLFFRVCCSAAFFPACWL